MTRIGLAFVAALGLQGAAAAADTALLIGNSSYDNAGNLNNVRALRLAERPLRQAGFDVFTGLNVETATIREGLSRVVSAEEDDRIVIALSGHFVQSAGGEVWFLGTDADRPNLGNVGAHGVALSTVMEIAANAPGRALVLLGTSPARINLGGGLQPGVTLPDPPQGVTVALGSPADVARLARVDLPVSGVSLAETLTDSDLQVAGFLSASLPFIAGQSSGAITAPAPVVPEQAQGDPEGDLWQAVAELNTEGAYMSYLRQYPSGRFASEARATLETLRDPLRIAAEAENALGFDRDDRRQIQSDLTVMGYDTNGIDGIFGNGTRGAIRRWQSASRLDETGYFTARSLRLLRDQAAIRRAEIEAEEAVRQAERDRLDRAYWAATGAGSDEPGLRAYLARYPEGQFAGLAREQLTGLADIRAEEAAAAERAAWDFAARQDSVRAYRGYLAAYPQGSFSQDAANRIATLRGQPAPFPQVDVAALRAREDALNLPTITRLLIERRLQGEGLNPGAVDGRFNDQTRVAIRAFQEAQGIEATGFLDQQTVSRFLANGIQVILRSE